MDVYCITTCLVSLIPAVCRKCEDGVVKFDNFIKISLFLNEHKKCFPCLNDVYICSKNYENVINLRGE